MQRSTALRAVAALVGVCGVAANRCEAKAPAGQLLAPANDCHLARAGRPHSQWPWGKPQKTWNYAGYYVGGGNFTPVGRGRCPDEGTWGWDYIGAVHPRRVMLDWWQRPFRQGRTGQYEPDGPRPLHALHSRKEE